MPRKGLPLFDTNVLIGYRPQVALVREYLMAVVVVQELLVGCTPAIQEQLISRAEELHERGLLVVPDRKDWVQVGTCLNRLLGAQQVGGERLTREAVNMLVRDALIARCAVKSDAQLITSNETDFRRIKTVFRGLKFTTPSSYFGVRPR